MSLLDDEITKEISEALKEQKSLEYSTNINKQKFIAELNGGLGAIIKEAPSKVKIIEKPRINRFFAGVKKIIIKIFTKF